MCIKKIDTMIEPLRHISNQALAPALDLTIRLYMANIFFKSGWLKFKNFLNDDWGNTVFLFELEHPIPGIPTDIAAIMGTAGELILPILLALGLFTRFGAAGLIIMTAAIQFLVPDYDHPQHYLWMLLLAVPLFYGPKILSIDYWMVKFIRKT